MNFKLVSADGHLNEVDATWERVQKKRPDRAPRIVWNPTEAEVGPYLVLEGWKTSLDFTGRAGGANRNRESCAAEYIGEVIGPMGVSPVIGRTSNEVAQFLKAFRFEDWPGPWDPKARLAIQDRDGVAAEVLFPSHLRHFYELSVSDEPFFRDICWSYNEWLMDFCSFDPKRLVGLPVISILNPEGAAEDIRSYTKRGAKGFMIASSVPQGVSYGDKRFDPLWQAAVECNVPLSIHSSSGRFKQAQYSYPFVEHFDAGKLEIQSSLAEMVYGGLFDRIPDLRIIATEFDIGWAAYIWQRNRAVNPKNSIKLAPADYLDRNVWFTFQNDRAGCLTAPLFGKDRFMWGSDYPHGGTTWPNSQSSLDSQLEGLPPEIQQRLARQNTVDVYGLDF